MKKKILPLVMSIGIAASLAVPYAGYAASTTDKIDQQLTQLKKQKAEAQQKANDAENQIDKVHSEKDQATKDMNTLVQQVNEASKSLRCLMSKLIKSPMT